MKHSCTCHDCFQRVAPWQRAVPPHEPGCTCHDCICVHCPSCGGTNIEPKRDLAGKLYCRDCICVWDDPTTAPPTPSTGLDATLNERGARYGDYAGRSDITQFLKDAFRGCEAGWERLTASQRETLDMIASKIARILNGDPNYVDSWHDIAGYATLVENQLTGKPR